MLLLDYRRRGAPPRGATMSAHEPETPSFERIAADLYDPLRRYLERSLGDAATAEDLLQEVLIKIDRSRPTFEGRSSIETWAYTIATRVLADHFRKPAVRTKIVDIHESPDPVAAVPDVSEPLVLGEMTACIRDVIESLPPDYRAALVLHDLEGHTAAATAEISGCSLATAKIRIHRARQRMKRALQDECTFYHDEEDGLRCDRRRRGKGEE